MGLTMSNFKIEANVVDIVGKLIFPGRVKVENGKIKSVERMSEKILLDDYIMPGFIDAHVHIESSMLPPSEFARLAVVHGTVATVSDPHEIANVLGIEGVRYMLDNAEQTPFKFYFGASPCVPATPFETAGASLSTNDIRELLSDDRIKYMSEMMNFPGVLNEFPDVMEKIVLAKEFGKPIDGHAPGLTEDAAQKYISAGISTDHECFTLDEAIDKIYRGMKILIREGSAAKNFEALHKLIEARPEMVMLCSDDKHPDDLVLGHVNQVVNRALDMGFDIFKVLRAASLNAVNHYSLDVGLLQEGDSADFIICDGLKNMNILKTYINGELVAEKGKTLLPTIMTDKPNYFNATIKKPEDFSVKHNGGKIRVIEAIDGELITNQLVEDPKVADGCIVPDTERDILKLSVINRYEDKQPAVAFIKNFGLKKGAIASSVGHDSHNILAVGTNDDDLCAAVSAVIENRGGMAVAEGTTVETLPLPIAGLMNSGDGYEAAAKYSALDKKAKALGSGLHAPFMTLSFMALLVIPFIKLSDKGLFDGEKFQFIDLEVAG